MDITSKVAVITGGASGLGEATSRALAARGASVAIAAIVSVKEIVVFVAPVLFLTRPIPELLKHRLKHHLKHRPVVANRKMQLLLAAGGYSHVRA